MSESDLEAECNKLADAAGYLHRKLDVGPKGKGWIDQAYWGPRGEHFLVEFKTGNHYLSRLQTDKIWRLILMNHDVYVVRSVEEFRGLL